MCTKLKLILGLLILFSSVSLAAQNDNAGTTGFDTLKLYYNARVTAMGGAVVGIPQNHAAADFNPAAILEASNPAVYTTFMDHVVGSNGGSISYVLPKNKFVAWAAGLRYWNSGNIDRTEISSTGELIETGDTFGAQSFVASISTARFISSALDLGLGMKFIYDGIDDVSATALMLDAGILHHTVNEKIKIGLSARNIGFQTSYYTSEKYSENIPSVYTAGLSMKVLPEAIAAFDLSKASGENVVARLGVEYELNPAWALRGGLRSNAGDYYMDGALGYTAGLSLGAGWKVKNFDLDYAISSYGDLGIANQLSIKYNFDK